MDMTRATLLTDTHVGRGADDRAFEDALTVAIHRLGTNELTALRSDLVVGFVDDRFAVQYKPIIRIADRAVVGLQAVVKWDRPGTAVLPMDIFLAAAKLEGRQVDALRFVLARTSEDIADWRAEGIASGPVAVVMPTDRLVDGTVDEDLLAAIRFTGISPEHLSIDVHEAAFAPALVDHTAPVLARLADAGFRLAVTGFGTGGASPAVLRTHAIDELKIDAGLLARVGEDPAIEETVREIIALGRTLAAEVLAVGVVNGTQIDFLRAAGCGFAQGPAVAPAMDAAVTAVWLRDQQRVHVGHLAVACRRNA